MEDDKLKNGIKEIKEIKMTDLEKDRMLKNILNSPLPSHESPVKSPWPIFSFISGIHKNRLVYYGFVFSLAVVLGGGAVFASGNSLPGNIFYPLKVSVIEPLYSTFTFSSKSKAQYESSLITKRLVEAKTLKIKDKLDIEKEEKLNLLLEDHIEAFSKYINYDNEDLVINLQAELKAYARVLDLIGEQDDKISETARISANKIRDKFKENEDNEKYSDKNKKEERKKHIKEIIDSTTKELEKYTPLDSYPKRQIIIEDVRKTLEEADQFLKYVEEEDEKGDSREAYLKLLDSESLVKEADILLKSGLKFEDIEKGEEKD